MNHVIRSSNLFQLKWNWHETSFLIRVKSHLCGSISILGRKKEKSKNKNMVKFEYLESPDEDVSEKSSF